VLLPIIPVLWLSYSRAIARAEDSLRVRTDIALQRADRILRMADETLQRLAREIGSLNLVQASELMQRTVYYQPYFREAGLIDEAGNLVCTSLGPVVPPIAVPPEHKSNPAVPTMQIVGLIKTTVMPTESIIVGLPTSGRGEVNLLDRPVHADRPLCGARPRAQWQHRVPDVGREGPGVARIAAQPHGQDAV
jgi:sensor c-di-GMP phosphodiesterase-like protein